MEKSSTKSNVYIHIKPALKGPWVSHIIVSLNILALFSAITSCNEQIDRTH